MPSINDLLPLLRELNDLKRVRVAARAGSLAEQMFVRAWARLVRGEDLRSVARSETARALVAVRLGGVDAHVLAEAGLTPSEILSVFEGAFDALAGELTADAASLRGALSGDVPFEPEAGESLPFVFLLARQPHGDLARAAFPPESHAEHCAVVALGSFLAASVYGGAPERAFLTGLSHHFHNAYLPTLGEAGAALLGEHRHTIIETFRARVLATLPPPLRDAARASLDEVHRFDTPEAKAFQAGNLLDRVLEIKRHTRTSDSSLATGNVAPSGPVQKFQLDLLRETGFLPPAATPSPDAPRESAYAFTQSGE